MRLTTLLLILIGFFIGLFAGLKEVIAKPSATTAIVGYEQPQSLSLHDQFID